jgi:hypothetical protein
MQMSQQHHSTNWVSGRIRRYIASRRMLSAFHRKINHDFGFCRG